MNVLCTLEAFMNEIRKTDIAYGFYKDIKVLKQKTKKPKL